MEILTINKFEIKDRQREQRRLNCCVERNRLRDGKNRILLSTVIPYYLIWNSLLKRKAGRTK